MNIKLLTAPLFSQKPFRTPSDRKIIATCASTSAKRLFFPEVMQFFLPKTNQKAEILTFELWIFWEFLFQKKNYLCYNFQAEGIHPLRFQKKKSPT